MDQNISHKTHFGLFHIVALAYIIILIVSNVAATKVGFFLGQYLDIGTMYFPLLYIFNDVITEVYGFRTSRKVLWVALGCNICFALMLGIVSAIPGATDVDTTSSFDKIFNFLPRILAASVISFLIGEYANSVILAITKVKFSGQFFGFRAIFSTMIGVVIESILFAFGAFYGKIDFDGIMSMIWMLVFVKVLYEFVSLPLTIKLVGYLKKKEKIDHYDYNTKFNIFPF